MIKFLKNEKGDLNIWFLIVIPVLITLSISLFSFGARTTSLKKSVQLTTDGMGLYLATYSNLAQTTEGEYNVLNRDIIESMHENIFITLFQDSVAYKALQKEGYSSVEEMMESGIVKIGNFIYTDNDTRLTFTISVKLPKLGGGLGDFYNAKATVSSRR